MIGFVFSGVMTLASGPIPEFGADDLNWVLRACLLHRMPSPLFQQSDNWGVKKSVPIGVKLAGEGVLRRRPVMQYEERYHGTWRRMSATADNPKERLVVSVRDLDLPEQGRCTFEVFIGLPVKLKYEQQNWFHGKQVLGIETRARCWAALRLKVETTYRFAAGSTLLPDLLFRARIKEAQLNYSGFVLEHVAGIGGDTARFFGDTGRDLLQSLRPELERRALERANAAIVNAADTKEVRLSFANLLEGAKRR